MSSVTHGKPSTYNAGCRCDECKEGISAYNKRPDRSAARRSQQNKWRKTPKGREVEERAARKYRPTAKNIAAKRRHTLKQRGLTPDEYDRMFEAQDGKCAVCLRPAAESSKGLHVDHDHSCCATLPTCGKCNRGLLCLTCNMGIGHLREGQLLEAAIAYLERSLER